MAGTEAPPGSQLEELQREIAAGAAHTVRVCFADHYGVLRGRRISADLFAADPCRQGFCDGALVWDIRCAIFEEVDFSNYRTGYPDLFVHPDMDSLRACSWVPGEWAALGDCFDDDGLPLPVDPRGILRSVVARAQCEAVTAGVQLHVATGSRSAIGGLASELVDAASGLGFPSAGVVEDPSAKTIRVEIGPAEPLAVADGLVLLRTAARELAARLGLKISAMAQLDQSGPVTRTAVVLDAPESQIYSGFSERCEELSLLLRPLPAGEVGSSRDRLNRSVGEPLPNCSAVDAASDANPYLVLAATLAARAEREPSRAGVGSGEDPYRGSIERLADCPWAEHWFPRVFIHDAITLARREAGICDSGGGPWDRSRYWECG